MGEPAIFVLLSNLGCDVLEPDWMIKWNHSPWWMFLKRHSPKQGSKDSKWIGKTCLLWKFNYFHHWGMEVANMTIPNPSTTRKCYDLRVEEAHPVASFKVANSLAMSFTNNCWLFFLLLPFNIFMYYTTLIWSIWKHLERSWQAWNQGGLNW